MGGPRASTQRQIDRGLRCGGCKAMLSPDGRCPSCRKPDCATPMHRVYMHFDRTPKGYRVSFMEAALKTQVRQSWLTDSKERLLDMFERGAETRRLEDRQAFEFALNNGRGAAWLRLTAEQYGRLKGRA